MNEGAYIAIAALFCLLLGIGLTIVSVFAWMVLTEIKQLKASIEVQAKIGADLLTDGSLGRIGKSMSTLSGSLPELLDGFKEFSRVMKIFHKTAFAAPEDEGPEDSGAATVPPKGPDFDGDGPGVFFGYSEAAAAAAEVKAVAKRENLILTDEQLSHMRTEGQS